MTERASLGGLRVVPGFLDRPSQAVVLDAVDAVLAAAPFYAARMPGSGKPFSVRISNCGPLGWVSDETGYRYQSRHPETGQSWPQMPTILLDAWNTLGDYQHPPESCLINYYGPAARMGLHQDRDERDFDAPWFPSPLATPAYFASAAHGAAIRHARCDLLPATPWCSGERRAWPFMVSTAFCLGHRRCCHRAAGSISRFGGSRARAKQNHPEPEDRDHEPAGVIHPIMAPPGSSMKAMRPTPEIRTAP